MNRSYVGIVSLAGLQALYPEEDHVVRFLKRRAFRRRPNAGLMWAVLSEENVQRIRDELGIGEPMSALLTLQTEALFCGSILPSSDVDESGAA